MPCSRFWKNRKNPLKSLHSLEADVTVCACKESDLHISPPSATRCVTHESSSIRGCDIVFNTVPSLIFNKDLLMNTDRNTLIIDLASAPGGVDFEAAHKFRLDAVRALSLPGKCAPKTAGEIIKTTVFNIIEEVYR